MFVIARAITWAALFIAFVLMYVPARILARAGVSAPVTIGVREAAGMFIGAAGIGIALWCVATFATAGQGTPAPFDPPRRLVIKGPYRFVRNPMYIGAGMALAGAALVYRSWQIVGYAAVLGLMTHLFIVLYEEPTLRRTFGRDYDEYCGRVRRWVPLRTSARGIEA